MTYVSRSLSLILLLSTIGAPAANAVAQEGTRSAYDVITVLGCVQKEQDYRSKVGEGKGGVLGSGVGAANEFVLRSVISVPTETLKPKAKPTSKAFEEVYSVTGNLEHELERAVGKQVAASGYVEVAESKGTEKVKDLPRMKVEGWHVVSDHCGPNRSK